MHNASSSGVNNLAASAAARNSACCVGSPSGELVELPLQAYPHTDWVVGVDLLWSQHAQFGKASAWLRQYLQAFKVFELDRNGNRTIL
ncbi:MAG: hypothetical protein ACTJHW_09975 [Paenalcaligenes sp.]